MIIYVLKDPFTQEIRYIGKTTNSLKKRLNGHFKITKKPPTCHRQRWLNLLKSTKTPPLIEEIYRANDIDELNEMERTCIAFGRAIGLRLVNTAIGGEGGPMAEETKEKIRCFQSSPRMLEVKRRWAKKQPRLPMYSSDGRIFNGRSGAAQELGVSIAVIQHALSRGGIIRSLGVRISREESPSVPTQEELAPIHGLAKTVYCSNGMVFHHIKHAAEYAKLRNSESLAIAIRSKRPIRNGLRFSYLPFL